MCANLVHIYHSQRDHEKLKAMLDLITAVNPEVRQACTSKRMCVGQGTAREGRKSKQLQYL